MRDFIFLFCKENNSRLTLPTDDEQWWGIVSSFPSMLLSCIKKGDQFNLKMTQ